jgi:hypothetical protein
LTTTSTPYLPPETVSGGFDNVADAQSLSPTLLEGYLRAAGQISGLAMGDRSARRGPVTFKVPTGESRMRHIEGDAIRHARRALRGHTFPADGDYVLKVELVRTVTGEGFGNTYLAVSDGNEQLAIRARPAGRKRPARGADRPAASFRSFRAGVSGVFESC